MTHRSRRKPEELSLVELHEELKDVGYAIFEMERTRDLSPLMDEWLIEQKARWYDVYHELDRLQQGPVIKTVMHRIGRDSLIACPYCIELYEPDDDLESFTDLPLVETWTCDGHTGCGEHFSVRYEDWTEQGENDGL